MLEAGLGEVEGRRLVAKGHVATVGRDTPSTVWSRGCEVYLATPGSDSPNPVECGGANKGPARFGLAMCMLA